MTLINFNDAKHVDEYDIAYRLAMRTFKSLDLHTELEHSDEFVARYVAFDHLLEEELGKRGLVTM